ASSDCYDAYLIPSEGYNKQNLEYTQVFDWRLILSIALVLSRRCTETSPSTPQKMNGSVIACVEASFKAGAIWKVIFRGERVSALCGQNESKIVIYKMLIVIVIV
ncbi:hypothetical protein DICVIV_02948, partial [Dictyocaulus viviparus]